MSSVKTTLAVAATAALGYAGSPHDAESTSSARRRSRGIRQPERRRTPSIAV